MLAASVFRKLRPVMVLMLLLSGLAGAVSAGPAEPAPSPPRPSGGVTSIVPPPPQVVEKLQQEGRPLPDLLSYKATPNPARRRSLQGTVKLLAILVDFSDVSGTVTNWTAFNNNLLFGAPVSGRGSVRDYYDEITHSQITLVTVDPFDANYNWQHAAQTMAYYAYGQYGISYTVFPHNAAGYVAEAIAQADAAGVDFSQYDNDGDLEVDTLLVIHAGTGAEWSLNANHIWSHAAAISWMGGPPNGYTYDGVKVDRYVTVPEYWETATSSTTDMTIGVIAHEIAHGLFGVTDLYDLDISSYGIGQWGLMSYGDWNGPPKWNNYRGLWVSDGSSPAWPMAWTRLVMGIDTAPLVLSNQSGVTLAPVETTAGAAIRLKSGPLWAQEYFLLENRQRIAGGYDEYLPAGGLLIWHVDEMQWSIYSGPDNDNECPGPPHCSGACYWNHYLVALEQADGLDHLEKYLNAGDGGDPFPGSAGRTSWRPYNPGSPVNPESGTWFDSNCNVNSCIDIINIGSSPPNITLDINQAACTQVDADLGDAPSSWNTHGNTAMTAYPAMPPLPWVQAWFPTVYMGGGTPPGPRHHFTQVDSWLGLTLPTGEDKADWMPDQDNTPNIWPPNDTADQDSSIIGGDDGVVFPVPIAPCGYAPPYLQYMAYARRAPPYGIPMPRYVNAWFDWNRDGDWADTISCPGGLQAAEWAIRDELVSMYQGQYVFLSMPFVSAAAVVAEGLPFESWMRLSIADMPAPAPYDGRGPLSGYDLGETEDYRLHLFAPLQMTLDPPGPHPPGQHIIYHIGFQPLGNVLGVGAVVSDVLPLGIDYVASVPPAAYDPASRTVTWTNINLTPNQATNLDLIVQISGTPGQTITNTAYLLWGGTRWTNASYTFQVACAPNDPQAEFTWSQPACAGSAVAFTNLSTGTLPLAYAWDLDGDGDTDSNAEHPSWTYGTAGLYTVTLTVSNSCGQDTAGHTFDVRQPVQSVAIAGPASLLVDQVGLYKATLLPPDAANPTLLWDNGDTTVTTTRSWAAPGLYTIAVTASNECGSVSDVLEVLVSGECISLTGVTIAGPVSLQVNEEGTYSATPEPPTATSPLYLWSNGDSAATTVYSWTSPGTYNVVVTATNCQGVAVGETFPVLVTSGCISLTGVTIAGPPVLQPGEVGNYMAWPAPPTATNPAYLWNNGLAGPSAAYSWPAAGSYTVTVTATNCLDVSVTDSLVVQVRSAYRIYLPLILRGAP